MTDFHKSLDRALERTEGRACTCPPSEVNPRCPAHVDLLGGDTHASLSDVVHNAMPAMCADAEGLDAPPCWSLAQRILASEWLAAHDAEVRATERERIAAAIEAACLGVSIGPRGSISRREGMIQAAAIARATEADR